MTFVVDGTVAALVAILVQTMLKPLLELRIKPDAPGHDNAVRAVALLLGVLLLAADTLIGGPWPATGNAWLLLVGSGLMSGLGAVGGYHLFSGSATPATTDPAPTPPLDYAALAASLAPMLTRLAPAVPAYTFPEPAPTGGSFTLPPLGPLPTGAANSALNLPPPTLTEAANAGRQGMPASLVSEGERTATLPPEPAPQSPAPVPVAPATPPA